MIRYLSIASILIFMAVLSCVKPYEFDPQNYEKVLVIEAQITNDTGPYQVNLTYTYPLDTSLNATVNNAQVWVEDQNGTRANYTLQENGNYLSEETFQGEVGNSYQLHVMIDGEEYISESEKLAPGVAIESIYSSYVQKASETSNQFTGGLQLFIDSEETNHKYFRYSWEEAYKIMTPFPVTHEVLEDSSIVYLEKSRGVCYKENFSRELIYGTTTNSTASQMIEQPVRYISEETQLLRTRYTILVKQYAISEAAYVFYKQLDENNESGGSLFDQQGGAVIGNIQNMTDPTKNVIGYFEAAGVTEKRTFISSREVDPRFNQSDFPYYCRISESIITSNLDSVVLLNKGGYYIYYLSDLPFQVGMQSRACTDCSFYAELEPPSYWIE